MPLSLRDLIAWMWNVLTFFCTNELNHYVRIIIDQSNGGAVYYNM